MWIDDPALPAAPHLVGDTAEEALSAAVTEFGGRLHSVRSTEVQYRPGKDLVVRYGATVGWGDDAPHSETMFASTTVHGIPHGTVAVEATDEDGTSLSVGVWRWPYDPALVGLAEAVTPVHLAQHVAGLIAEPFEVRVRAFRPTERAVVQVTGADRADVFVKVLPPDTLLSIVERHEALHAAGVPVPQVLRVDPGVGLLVMTALRGTTLREHLTSGGAPWPASVAFERVFADFAATSLRTAPPVRSRASTALGHVRMLAAVAPELAERLDDLAPAFAALSDRAAGRSGPVIHGDLYDAQVVTDGSRITGVLDIDDAGPGDPIDDRATVIGFLMVKALHAGSCRRPLMRYAAHLRRGFSAHADESDLDLATAAVIVGLATGPFRTQRAEWRAEILPPPRARTASRRDAGPSVHIEDSCKPNRKEAVMPRLDWRIAAVSGAAIGTGLGGFVAVRADDSEPNPSEVQLQPSERQVRALSSPVSIPAARQPADPQSVRAPNRDRGARAERADARRAAAEERRGARRTAAAAASPVSPISVVSPASPDSPAPVPPPAPAPPAPDSPASPPSPAPAPAPDSPASPNSPASPSSPGSGGSS